MFFAFSIAAYAQVTATFQVGSVPETSAVKSGQTEKTGTITFTQLSGTTPANGSISVSYGVPITNCFGAGCFLAPAQQIQVSASITGITVNNAAGMLTILIPANQNNLDFQISNVRVALAGSPIAIGSSLSASISTVGVALLAGQTSVTVISAVGTGIAGVAVPSAFFPAPASINAVTLAGTYGSTINVTEGFLNAFGVTNITDTTQTLSVMVRLTVSQAPPAGVSITFPASASTTLPATGAVDVANAFEVTDQFGNPLGAAQTISSTSTSLAIYYRVGTNTDLTQVENLSIPYTIAVSPFAALPLPTTTISVTATFAPIGTPFGPFGQVLTGALGPIPRYADVEVGPATILIILPGTTTLLMPYATSES